MELAALIGKTLRYADGQAAKLAIIGGAALQLHGLKTATHDLDIYTSNGRIIEAWRKDDPELIDLCDNTYLWGQLNVPDILKGGKKLMFEKCEFTLPTVETLFILKADSGRERDIADLSLLRAVTTPSKILKRMGQLKPWNDESTWYYCAENLLSEIEFQYGCTIEEEHMLLLNLDEEQHVCMSNSFRHAASIPIRMAM